MTSITQVKIRGRPVGLVGLVEAIEEAREKEIPLEKVDDFLLERLQEKNYIPREAREAYREAVYRFYCRQVGIPVEEPSGQQGGLSIRILGPGCYNCDKLQQEVLQALSEMGLPADVEHVTDLKEIASYGVAGVPALVINDRVVCVGKVPPRKQISQWLSEASQGG